MWLLSKHDAADTWAGRRVHLHEKMPMEKRYRHLGSGVEWEAGVMWPLQISSRLCCRLDMKTSAEKWDRVRMIDQRYLPGRETYIDCTTYQQVGEAIVEMVIRGAPAIGVAAAMGVALGAQMIEAEDRSQFRQQLNLICDELAK